MDGYYQQQLQQEHEAGWINLSNTRLKKSHDTEKAQAHTLNCLAKVISSALTADNILIDLPRSNVVVTPQRHVQESFVIAEIQINFTAIVKYKHLT